MDFVGQFETQEQAKIVSIAKVCHQANKAWCEAVGDTSKRIGMKLNNGNVIALSTV